MKKVFKNGDKVAAKRAYMVIISVALCFVFGLTIGLSCAFRQKLDQNFESSTNVQLTSKANLINSVVKNKIV